MDKGTMHPFQQNIYPIVYMGRLEREEPISMDLLPLKVNRTHHGSDQDATCPDQNLETNFPFLCAAFSFEVIDKILFLKKI